MNPVQEPGHKLSSGMILIRKIMTDEVREYISLVVHVIVPEKTARKSFLHGNPHEFSIS